MAASQGSTALAIEQGLGVLAHACTQLQELSATEYEKLKLFEQAQSRQYEVGVRMRVGS